MVIPTNEELRQLTLKQLTDLNHQVIDEIRLKDQEVKNEALGRLPIGTKVRFRHRHFTLNGIVVKRNQLTAVVDVDGNRWRVSPGLLEKLA